MRNKPIISAFDGAGMGLGFTFALVCIGAVRELLGAGSIFGVAIMPASYQPISIFILARRILRSGLLNCFTEQVKDAFSN